MRQSHVLLLAFEAELPLGLAVQRVLFYRRDHEFTVRIAQELI